MAPRKKYDPSEDGLEDKYSPQDREPTDSELEAIYGQSNFSSFHHDYTYVMTEEEVVLFGYLCTKRSYLLREGKIKPKGWFYCTIKQVQDHINISVRKQSRIIAALAEKGFLDRRQKRKSPSSVETVRFFRINLRTVYRAIKQIKPKTSERLDKFV